jgi:hypothetical protein
VAFYHFEKATTRCKPKRKMDSSEISSPILPRGNGSIQKEKNKMVVSRGH